MITEKVSQYFIIGLILAIIVVGSAGFLRPTVISQLAEENRLDVTGTATLSVDPDETFIRVGAETEAASADDSQRANAGIINNIRLALNRTDLSPEDVTTSTYYLEIVREYDETAKETKITGYKTVHILKIKSSNINNAGEYVDAAVSGGANRIDSVSFSLSDEKQNEIRTEALKQAGQDARTKADASALGLGVSVRRVVRASEGYVYVAPYASDYRTLEASAAPTQITPGQVDVSASVSVTYEIG